MSEHHSGAAGFVVERETEYRGEPMTAYRHSGSGLEVMVSTGHPYPNPSLRRALSLASACDLTRVVSPTIVYSASNDGGFVALGDPHASTIHFSYPSSFNPLRLSQSQRVFDHEMGHIVGRRSGQVTRNGGPISSKGWERAREEDAAHIRSLPRDHRRCLAQSRFFGGFATSLSPRAGWVTPYALAASTGSGQVEDWAESWSLFLDSRRRGRLFYDPRWDRSRGVRFEEIWPARARLLDAFLEGKLAGEPARAPVVAEA